LAEEKNTEVVQEKKAGGFDFKIIIIGLVVFLITIGASYFMLRSLIAPLVPQKEEAAQTLTGNLVSAGEFTTNINDEGGTRFLKVEVYVEVEDEKVAEEITAFMPVIKDTILSTLTSKSVADLEVSNQKSLKAEMKKKINAKLGSEVVKSVYFTTFIMQ